MRLNNCVLKFTFQYGYISTWCAWFSWPFLMWFTFQYGYISTKKEVNEIANDVIDLHSNMVIFQRWVYVPRTSRRLYLHSNMVIFQPLEVAAAISALSIFTFQYGYISTGTGRNSLFRLHIFTFQYGYISTWNPFASNKRICLFTFQYGYISTPNSTFVWAWR